LEAGESYIIQNANSVVIEAVEDAIVILRDTSEELAEQAAF
jgi:hypothetical protein